MKKGFSCLFSIGLALCMVLLIGSSTSDAIACKSLPGSPTHPHNQPPGKYCPPHKVFPIAGSIHVMSFKDFTDVQGYEDYRCAIDWYLSSGLTNGGQTWDTFGPGDYVPRWEPVMNVYRFYSIMNEAGTFFEDVPMNAPWSPPPHLRYGDATSSLWGAGIISATYVDGKAYFYPNDYMTIEDLLVLFYNAMNSDESSKTAGTSVAAGSLDDLTAFYTDAGDISADKIAAVAGMIKTGYFTPVGNTINPKGYATRLDMINLLYTISGTRAQRQMPADREARILVGGIEVDGGYKNIVGQSLTAAAQDTSALYAKNGAKVRVGKSVIASTDACTISYASPLAYRWGLTGSVLANGPGTIVNISKSDITSYAQEGGLFATCGGVINLKNSILTQPSGGHTMNITYNGTINLENVDIKGTGRTFSSDFFGGTIIYRNVNSVKDSGGAFFTDENTTAEMYNSRMIGTGGMGSQTGVSRTYYKNTVVEMGSGIVFSNNTSLPSDIATCTIDGGKVTLTDGDLFTVQRLQRAIIRINHAGISLPDGANILNVGCTDDGCGQAKLYLKNVNIVGNIYVEDGSTAEVYLTNSTITGTVTGNVTVVTDKKSKIINP